MSSKNLEAEDSFYLGKEYLSKFNVNDNPIEDFIQHKEVDNSLILSRCLTVNFLIKKYF
jgi:transposase